MPTLLYPEVNPADPAEVRGRKMLKAWADLVPVFDYTREFARSAIGDDAPELVKALVGRGEELAAEVERLREIETAALKVLAAIGSGSDEQRLYNLEIAEGELRSLLALHASVQEGG